MRLDRLLVLVALTGCADASGRFQAFEERRGALDDIEAGAGAANEGGASAGGAGGEQGCMPPAPGVVQGLALLALETTTLPGAAILFLGRVETPASDDKTAVKFSYRALDASDRRTKVGDEIVVGPYAINDDGSFDAPTPKSTLPGSANALSPGIPITSELILHGTICGVAPFYCGTVTGTITEPFEGPATGQFGLTLLETEDDIPARPRFGCAPNALAPALKEPAE